MGRNIIQKPVKIQTEKEAYHASFQYKDSVDELSNFQAIPFDHQSIIALGRIGVKASSFFLFFNCF